MNRKPGSRSRRNLGMTSRQLGMLVILAVLLLLVVSVTLVFALDLFDVSLAPVLPTEPSTRSAGELEGTPSPGDQTSLPPSSTLSFQGTETPSPISTVYTSTPGRISAPSSTCVSSPRPATLLLGGCRTTAA